MWETDEPSRKEQYLPHDRGESLERRVRLQKSVEGLG